jgi:Gas vesicle protein
VNGHQPLRGNQALRSNQPLRGNQALLPRQKSDSLADVLERVLERGVVVAGDIVVNVADVELLTLKVRLLICSLDTAKQIGIDWWQSDPFLTGREPARALPPGSEREETRELRARLERLEAQLKPAQEE